jgi:hypothetical protein
VHAFRKFGYMICDTRTDNDCATPEFPTKIALS